MQLGFVSAIFGDLSFEEVLRHANELGYDCVEVMCWPPGGPDRKYGGVMHLDVTDFPQSKADDTNALCEQVRRHDFRIGILFGAAFGRSRASPG